MIYCLNRKLRSDLPLNASGVIVLDPDLRVVPFYDSSTQHPEGFRET
jgi:hypothetical protein